MSPDGPNEQNNESRGGFNPTLTSHVSPYGKGVGEEESLAYSYNSGMEQVGEEDGGEGGVGSGGVEVGGEGGRVDRRGGEDGGGLVDGVVESEGGLVREIEGVGEGETVDGRKGTVADRGGGFLMRIGIV